MTNQCPFLPLKTCPASAKPDQQQSFVTFTRRRSSYGSGESFEPDHQHEAGSNFTKRCRRGIAALALAVVLLLFLSSQHRSPQDLSRHTDSAGNYLRQIAAVHDWKQAAASLGSDVYQLRQDLQSVTQAVMASCAQQLVLPEVKVLQHIPTPAWFPPTGSRLPAIAALDLNCSNPDAAADCAVAAASNSYEGEAIQLTAEELQELLQAPLVVEVYDVAADPLASLNIDCTTDPDACMDISSSTNSYEGPSSNVAHEVAAAAYLHDTSTGFVHATTGGAWDAVIGSQQVQQPTQKERESVLDATNKYEGSQVTWQYKRQAEEAGAHYLPISTLDLDCSPGADAAAQAECMLSRAVNRYESATAGAAAGRVDQHHLAGSEHPDMLPSTCSAEPAPGSANNRIAAAKSEQRVYFKNPCNSPASQVQYKSRQRQQQGHRRYYKNPANAPTTLDTLLPKAVKATQLAHVPSRTWAAASLNSTSLWVALAVLLATAWLLEDLPGLKLQGLCAGPAAVYTWSRKTLRREKKVRRTRSTMLVPCASQELPAPQLMHLELHPRSPLPTLSTLAGTFDAPTADLHVTTHGRCPTSVSDTGLTPMHQQHQVHDAAAASNTATQMASPLPATGSMAALQDVMIMQPVIQATAAAVAADLAASGTHMSHGAGPTLSELLQVPDDIQAGMDSPRAMSRAGHRRSLTPLPPRSLAGTPSATGKGE